MAGVGSQEWRDTREVVRTMQELYKHADEPATAVQIKEVLSEVQALFAARDTSMSEDVKDLSTRKSARASTVASLEGNREFAKQVAELQGMRDTIVANIESMKNTTRITSESVAKLKQQVSEIKARVKELGTTHDIPAIKLFINMYTSITNLKWDYDVDTIKGVVIPPGGAVARPFNIDPAQASELEVADRIWSLIELAHTPPTALDGATQ